METGGPTNRFERHPWLTGLGLLVACLVLVEIALRVAAPSSLRFAHDMRQVHRYSRVSRVDLVAGRSVRLRLDREDRTPLLDFRLTTGEDGFRVLDEPGAGAAPEPGTRFLHAIGDSYTMGWGVEGGSAYPAELDRMLPSGWRALNLGVDGFGAIGATAKSVAVADRFPPAHAVYLFSPNDLEDDGRAATVAARPAVAHLAAEALDAARRASYVAALPFALRYRLQFRLGPASPATGSSTVPAEVIALSDPGEPAEPPDPACPTLGAVLRYRDFLAARGAGLTVLVLSTQPESLAFLRFCRGHGLAARLFDVPAGLRLPDEGHFNAAGNAAVARLALRTLAETGVIEVGEAGR